MCVYKRQEYRTLNIQDMSKECKNTQFYKTLQKGDLLLKELIQSALVLFGFSRNGKTTLGHKLSNGALVAIKDQRSELSWVPADYAKYPNAKVSASSKSVTWIPNVFDTQYKVKIIDEPGFGDSEGFFKILSNGFFHYRTFSRVAQMRFVVVIDYNQTAGSGQNARKTVLQFLKMFKEEEQIFKKVIQASTIVVTKVSEIVDLQKVFEGLFKNQRENNIYKKFLEQMINKKRIMRFEKPKKEGDFIKIDDKMIKEILSTKPYIREKIRSGLEEVIDMSEIHFGVSNEIKIKCIQQTQSLKQFQTECKQFLIYSQKKMQNFFSYKNGFYKILVEFSKEISLKQHQPSIALGNMREWVQKYQKDYCSNQEKHKQKRDRLAKEFFADFSSSQHQKKINKNFDYRCRTYQQFFAFFKAFQQQKIARYEYAVRNIEYLQYITIFCRNLFEYLHKLRRQEPQSKNIVNKYHYFLQHILNEQKVFFQIFMTPDIFQQFQKIGFPTVDIVRVLDYDIINNINDYKNEYQNALANYLQQVEGKEEVNKVLYYQKTKILNQQSDQIGTIIATLNKLAKRLLTGEYTYPKDTKHCESEVSNCVILSLKYLKRAQNRFKEGVCESSVCYVSLMNGIAKMLVQFYRRGDLAIVLFSTVNNASKVIMVYKSMFSAESNRNILIELGKYAASVGRKQLAVECFQQAYDRSTTKEEFQESSLLITQQQVCGFQAVQDYLTAINNFQFKKISKEVVEEINKIAITISIK